MRDFCLIYLKTRITGALLGKDFQATQVDPETKDVFLSLLVSHQNDAVGSSGYWKTQRK